MRRRKCVQLCCLTWRPRESSFASCTSFGSRRWRANGGAACRAPKAATPLLLDQAASRTSFAESMSPKLLVVPSGCPSTACHARGHTPRHPSERHRATIVEIDPTIQINARLPLRFPGPRRWHGCPWPDACSVTADGRWPHLLDDDWCDAESIHAPLRAPHLDARAS